MVLPGDIMSVAEFILVDTISLTVRILRVILCILCDCMVFSVWLYIMVMLDDIVKVIVHIGCHFQCVPGRRCVAVWRFLYRCMIIRSQCVTVWHFLCDCMYIWWHCVTLWHYQCDYDIGWHFQCDFLWCDCVTMTDIFFMWLCNIGWHCVWHWLTFFDVTVTLADIFQMAVLHWLTFFV